MLAFDSDVDCCYSVNCNDATSLCNGDWSFCSSSFPCGQDEGDCNSDDGDECQDGFVCGTDNCPSLLGFSSSVDCCFGGGM